MGGVSKGKAIFPLNAGKKDSDITDDNDDFDYAGHAAKKTEAYLSVSVNPTIVQNNIQYENGMAGSQVRTSANFLEIRNTSHSGSISNDMNDKIGNRIYPSNNTETSHAVNRDETHSFKVKVYDSQLANSETNRKFVYSTSDYPATEEIGLDIENYDYFILLNPDTLVMGTDAIRPHFAKVTRIISFDEFGDGLEFTPAYPTEVGANTKFEIYKGPAKTDTSVVAVSYGLRGDGPATTPKHDRVNHCSRPTWYFYNDRLDEKDQLDYMTKYNLTHLRWWQAFANVQMDYVSTHGQYQSSGAYFTIKTTGDRDKLLPGMSIFNSSGVYLGNIRVLEGTNNLTLRLDYARISISPTTIDFNVQIGKTIQNVIFRTEPKFNNTIHSLGEDRIEATLVDANKVSDDTNSSDFYKWTNAFPKMHRHIENLDSATTTPATIDGKLTGPGKYITFEKANYKNNKIPLITHALLNQPRNKMSQLAQFSILDNSGLSHEKVKEEADLILEKNIYNGSLSLVKFHGKASRHATDTSRIVLKDIKKKTDLRAVLGNGVGFSKISTGVLANGMIGSNATTTLAVDTVDATTMFQVGDTVYKSDGSTIGVISSLSATQIVCEDTIPVAVGNNDNLKKIQTGPNCNTIVEIDGYYYVVDTIDNQFNDQQTFKIKDKKTISANTWTGSAVAENFSSKEMKVAPYTGVLNTSLEPDTEYDHDSSRLTMSDVTVDKDKTKLYGARIVEGSHRYHNNKIDYGDKDNKYLKIQDAERVFYQRSNENISRFYYYKSGYAISDVAFKGIVEDITNSSKNGLTTYKVVGRDETSKLLSQTVTQNTTFMEDISHTSLPPILNATAITGISSLSVTNGGTTITWSGTASITPFRYGLILNQAGELLGEVKNYTSGNITLYDGAYTTPTTTTSLQYYHPYDSTWANYIVGTKALGSNELHNSGTSAFTSVSEKAMDFNGGLSLTLNKTPNPPVFEYANIKATSNTGSYLKDRTLGYDVSSPKAISTDDSIFAFNAGNENGARIEKLDIATVNKETFDVVQVNEKDEAETTLSVAPIFPILLGRIDANSSDARGNCNIYLVNNNADTGGFIHRLQDSFGGSGYFGPKTTIRYWDLQKFSAGTIQRNHDSIYKAGTKPQQIQGYAVGYGIKADGSLLAPTATNDSKPLSGSNTIDGWTYVANFFGDQNNSPIIKSYPVIRDMTQTALTGHRTDGLENDIEYGVFEQIDPRAETYELLATGDIFPASKLRHNNLGYHTKDYSEYGVMLEANTTPTGETTHQKYVGKTKQTLQKENMFEESSVKSATQTTNQMRRFGVMRLVEATFDWHFNPVNYETLPKAEDIPTVKAFDYVQFDSPTVEGSSDNVAWDSNGVYFSSTGLIEADGRVWYQKDKIGVNPSSAYDNVSEATHFNGFVALNQDSTMSSTRWIINQIADDLGASNSDGLLRYDGGTWNSGLLTYNGVQSFRVFGTTDFNIDNLTSHDGGPNLKTARRRNTHNIRFSHVWMCAPTIISTNFKWSKALKDGNIRFLGHDIILPLISEEYAGTWSGSSQYDFIRETDYKDRRLSGHHHFSTGQHMHTSRVMAGLYHRELSDTDSDLRFRFGVGQTANNSDSLAHIYENCIGVFRGFKKGSDVIGEKFGIGVIDNDDITLSTPLSLDTDAKFSAFVGSNSNDFDQHTRNLMVQKYPRMTDSLHMNYGGGGGNDSQPNIMLNLGGWPDYGVYFPNTGYGFIGDISVAWTGKSGNDVLTGVTPAHTSQQFSAGDVIDATQHSLAMVGTRAEASILSGALVDNSVVSNASGIYNTYAADTTHRGATKTSVHFDGGAISAQMLIKPVFNIVDNQKGVDVSTITITFDLNSDTEHAWLSYMPNLTGYYLVSENHATGGEDLRSTTNADIPKKIYKIKNHLVSTDPTTSQNEIQQIILDTAFSSAHGSKYRLMRPSEITFDKTEDEIKFNTMLSDGKGRDWKTGGDRDLPVFSESVYYMYLLLDIDHAHATIERRTGADAIAPFSDLADGAILNMNVTDGQSSKRKNIVVNKTVTIEDGENQVSRTGLTLSFDGELNGSGVVSFGEVFDITLGRKPKLKNIEKCSIGTSFAIASQLEKEVENMVKIAGLEYNPARSFSNPSGNIVSAGNSMLPTGVLLNGSHAGSSPDLTVDGTDATTIFAEGDSVFDDTGQFAGFVKSVTATKITLTANYAVAMADNENLHREGVTCSSTVTGISAGDVIYSYDGHLIGEVGLGGVSGTTIGLRNRYYNPTQYDELVTINKKTFATNLKFNHSNLYDAINSLILKRGLDYNIKNGEFITRNIEDTGSLRRYALSYKESNRLVSVGSNKSMFDKANKVVVVGDKVQYELEKPTKKQTRTVKVVDPSIKSRTDAETKAIELMSLYEGDSRKIDIEIQKEGMELLEAGDILRLNFPNHNIPVDDYIVFEIENVLAGTLKLKVGTFDKTIAERLSELSTQQSEDSTTLLGRDAVVLSAGKFLFDTIRLKDISFTYSITGPSNALSRNSNMGFDDIVGFTEEVGFEHSTVTKKTYRDRFYEQEGY